MLDRKILSDSLEALRKPARLLGVEFLRSKELTSTERKSIQSIYTQIDKQYHALKKLVLKAEQQYKKQPKKSKNGNSRSKK